MSFSLYFIQTHKTNAPKCSYRSPYLNHLHSLNVSFLASQSSQHDTPSFNECQQYIFFHACAVAATCPNYGAFLDTHILRLMHNSFFESHIKIVYNRHTSCSSFREKKNYIVNTFCVRTRSLVVHSIIINF